MWERAITTYDDALRHGHTEAAAVFIEKARCLWSLDRREEVKELLANVASSESQLILGDIALAEERHEEGVQMVKSALAGGALPPADAAYAKALLASTDSEALTHLNDCVRASPYHHPGRTARLVLFVFLGSRREILQELTNYRTIFPEAPSYFLEAIAYTSIGETEAARSALEMAPLREKERFLAIQRAFSFIGEMATKGSIDWPSVTKNIGALVLHSKSKKSLLPMHLQCFTLCAQEMRSVLTPLVVAQILFRGGRRKFSEALQRAASHVQEGSLVFMAAAALQADVRRIGELQEACNLYHRAVTGGSLFPSVQKANLAQCFRSYADLYSHKDATEAIRELARSRATEAIQEFLRVAGPEDTETIADACSAANRVSEYDLAEELAKLWRTRDPESPKVWRALAYVHSSLGEHFKVLASLRRMEELGRPIDESLLRVQKQSMRAIASIAAQGVSPDADR